MKTSLILFFISFKFFRPIEATCTVSKYNDGFRDWIKCSNSSVSEAMEKGRQFVAAITISQSRIFNIPENAFTRYAKSLEVLNLQNCGIRDMHFNALSGLTFLKKLNLPNNNITTVRPNWFISLVALEQLDLSFNSIKNIDISVFSRLTNLQKLNLDDNLLTCLEIKDMTPLRRMMKIRVIGNPLSLMCRARMTLWFNDKGINYSSELGQKSESWLDRVLWLCAEGDYGKTVNEKTMRECVLLNIFNQLSLALKTTNSYQISSQQCMPERNFFMRCIVNNGKEPASMTNSKAVTNIILAMQSARKKFNIF